MSSTVKSYDRSVGPIPVRIVCLALLGLLMSGGLPVSVQELQAADAQDQKRHDARDKGVAQLVKVLDSGKLGRPYYEWIRCNDYAVTGLVLLCQGNGWNSGPYATSHEKLVFCSR